MKSKIVSPLCLILIGFLLVVLFVSVQTVKARTINVDDDGGKDYTKIQDAVNAANTGDTVYVYNGTYNEEVEIDKTIRIVGESNQSTIIKGTGDSSSMGIYVAANHVSISNLKIYNFTEGIIFYFGSNDNTVTSNTITNCSEGVHLIYNPYFSGSSNNVITSNTLMNSQMVIYGDNVVSDNTINDKPLLYYKNIDATSSPRVLDGVDANGIILYNCTGFVIKNNTLDYGGIVVGLSSQIEIVSNTISNGSYSIYSRSTDSVDISSNKITSGGVHIPNSNENIIEDNTITGGSGIILENSNRNTIESNIITDTGIDLSSSSNNNNIISNIIRNGYYMYQNHNGCYNGIHILVSNNNMITSNTIGNFGYGISLDGIGSTNTLEHNRIANCKYGIYIGYNSCGSVIVSNTIADSEYGIYLQYSANYNKISANAFTNCGTDIYPGISNQDILIIEIVASTGTFCAVVLLITRYRKRKHR